MLLICITILIMTAMVIGFIERVDEREYDLEKRKMEHEEMLARMKEKK